MINISAPHVHRCNFRRLGVDAEQCRGLFECEDDCVEDDIQTEGFCPEHEELANALEDIIDGRA